MPLAEAPEVPSNACASTTAPTGACAGRVNFGGLPASGIGGADSAGASGIALNRPTATDRGTGMSLPRPSALVTAWSARSILLRRPAHNSQLLVALRTSTACPAPSAAARVPLLSGTPAITVTPGAAPVTESHVVQSASLAVFCTIRSGAPGMPIRLPRGNLSSSLLFTVVGFTGRPAISRADVRFSTGCSSSPTFTYNAAVDRSANTGLLAADPFGRISENTKQPTSAVISISTPISTARV